MNMQTYRYKAIDTKVNKVNMKIISIEFNYCKVIQTNRMGFEETDIAGFIE